MHSQSDKFHQLFEAVSENIKRYGIDGFKFIMQTQILNPSFRLDQSKGFYENLLYLVTQAINENGIDKIIYLLQHDNNRITDLVPSPKIKEQLFNEIVQTVCRRFNIDENDLKEGKKRDGIGIYAWGIIVILAYEILGYNTHKVTSLIKKSQKSTNRYKNLIAKLNFRIPIENKILISYLETKKKLINTILNHGKQ